MGLTSPERKDMMLAVGDGERVVVGERDARGRPRTLRGPTQAQASTLVAARRNHRSELQATLRPWFIRRPRRARASLLAMASKAQAPSQGRAASKESAGELSRCPL